MGIIAEICRYPVKGLNAEALETATLKAARPLDNDRRFALAHAASAVDPMKPRWHSKNHFLNLSRDENLANLRISFDEESSELAFHRGGKRVAGAPTADRTGRMLINQFLAGFVPAGPRGNPKLIETSNGAFADHPEPWVSIVNLASVADIERVARQTIDPRRFRANIYISETDPWSERDWIDKEVGFGAARLKIVAPIERCAATNVAPDTGTRDLNIPLILERGFGHIETGVYGEVVDGGTITPGDAIVLRP